MNCCSASILSTKLSVIHMWILKKVLTGLVITVFLYWILNTGRKGEDIKQDIASREWNLVKYPGFEKTARRLLREIEEPQKEDILPFFNTTKHKEIETNFLLQPCRIIGEKGILKLREIQGNTWSGSYMKAVLVTFVESSVSSVDGRDLARRTWGSIRDINGWKFETVFVIQINADDEVSMNNLIRESSTYGDILVYEGLNRIYSHRLLSAIKWSSDNLPGDFYVAFVVEHYLVNIYALKEFILTQRPDIPPHNTVHLIKVNNASTLVSPVPQSIYCFGGLNNNSLVRDTGWLSAPTIRDNFGINAIWPAHCNLPFFASSVHLVKALCAEAKNTIDVDIDPILFVTGILREKLKRPKNIVNAKIQRPDFHFSYAKEDIKWLGKSSKKRTEELRTQWKGWLEILRWKSMILTKYL